MAWNRGQNAQSTSLPSGVREMMNRRRLKLAAKWALLAMTLSFVSARARGAAGPVELRVDNLKTPLGIDDARPSFSWQLEDEARGAKQTAYEVLVASNAELLGQAKADVWDSGRMEGGESLNVRYAGAALRASTRYFWQVKVWDAAGKAYPASEIGWWETGLMKTAGWQVGWIGYETAEEAAVRAAPAAW